MGGEVYVEFQLCVEDFEEAVGAALWEVECDVVFYYVVADFAEPFEYVEGEVYVFAVLFGADFECALVDECFDFEAGPVGEADA